MRHILAACPKLAQTEYLKRHHAVAAVFHKTICDEYGVETAKQTRLHHPEAMTETEEIKILWDLRLEHIESSQPGDQTLWSWMTKYVPISLVHY
jgi:hypothetical protein